MTTDFRQQKLTNRFHQLDANGDGYLQQDDFEAVARRLCDMLVPADKTAEREAIVDGYQQLWQYLVDRTDADRDGRVTLDEYLGAASAGSGAGMGGYERSVEGIVSTLFAVLDTDGDERLDRDEFATWCDAFQVSTVDGDALFARLDADGGGTVSQDELMAAVREFYAGDSADSAGAILFGLAR